METTWDGLPIAPDNPVASSVVIWRRAAAGREYLILHRAHHGPAYEGDWAWTPPSGARQPGETPADAAVRELAEETGLTLPLAPVAHTSEEVALFHAEIPVGAEVQLDAEHDAFAWAPLEVAAARCRPPVVGESLLIVDAALGD